MPELAPKEKNILEAIKKNHKKVLETRMVANLGSRLSKDVDPIEIASWMNDIAEIRSLAAIYLNDVTTLPTLTEKMGNGALAALVGGGVGSAVFLGMKALNTGPIGLIKNLFGLGTGDSRSIMEQTAGGVFSAALGVLVTKVLYDAFISKYDGDSADAVIKFNEEFNKADGLSKIIKKKSEELSKEIVKLFHFREMLLLGKISDNEQELDARAEFIKRANLKGKTDEAINAAIEAYFLKELNLLFNSSFKSLYEAHAGEIAKESASFFSNWFHQFFDSTSERQISTQQIQLKFMELCRDFLLSEKNEPTFLARYPKITATIGGILVGALVLGTLALAFGGPVTWGIAAIALVAFAVATAATYLIVTHIDKIHYTRDANNRDEIQYAVDQIDDEFLRLNKEIIERKDTSELNIKQAKDFKKVNDSFLGIFKNNNVARGSASGWLREYAARYRHSKAIEIDLGDEYKQLIIDSNKQTQDLIAQINQGNQQHLRQFISDTSTYLNHEINQKTISEFELIQKIKEQVIQISASVKVIPAELIEFYKKPINQGGLGGFESDLSHAHSLVPIITDSKDSIENPYDSLCTAASILYKTKELPYAGKQLFKGDAALREMLGLPGEDFNATGLTFETVDEYLNNSYEFLFALNIKIKPREGFNPLDQESILSNEFILYRALLLKQLASLCDTSNHTVATDVKYKIRAFIKQRFDIDPDIVFDDLINQSLMLEEVDETGLRYTKLANIAQIIHLDLAYNSVKLTPKHVINFYIQAFLKEKTNDGQSTKKAGIFAYGKAEIDLNPQGSQQYLDTVKQYTVNSKDFIAQNANNRALTSSGILDCYKYSMSIQVYQTMLRIAKDLRAIDPLDTTQENQNKIRYLKEAFLYLYAFSKISCDPLKESSEAKKIIDALQQIIISKEVDCSKLAESPVILEQINHVGDQINFTASLAEHVASGKGIFGKPNLPPSISDVLTNTTNLQ